MYVYKITNKINNKNYIGITNNVQRRWANECSYPRDKGKRQVIQEAVHKYGKQNFSFEILFENLNLDEACQLEEEMAIKYNSYTPFGYNIAKCGKLYPNVFSNQKRWGEDNPNAKLTNEEAQYILDNRDKPMYELYKDFENKISYSYFKQIYNHQKYEYLTTTTKCYPHNLEYSLQFSSGWLDYEDVISIRERYAEGEYWEKVYEDYKALYPHKWDFWNIYYGNRYRLVKPEIFSKERRKYHGSLGKQGEKNSRAKLFNEDTKHIRQLFLSGIPRKELYSLFPQVTPTSIRNVINNKTFKDVL